MYDQILRRSSRGSRVKRVKLVGLVSRSIVALSSMNYLKKRSWECALCYVHGNLACAS